MVTGGMTPWGGRKLPIMWSMPAMALLRCTLGGNIGRNWNGRYNRSQITINAPDLADLNFGDLVYTYVTTYGITWHLGCACNLCDALFLVCSSDQAIMIVLILFNSIECTNWASTIRERHSYTPESDPQLQRQVEWDWNGTGICSLRVKTDQQQSLPIHDCPCQLPYHSTESVGSVANEGPSY